MEPCEDTGWLVCGALYAPWLSRYAHARVDEDDHEVCWEEVISYMYILCILIKISATLIARPFTHEK